jgi:hypothetical protein
MAVTGKSYVNITPGKLNAGQPEIVYVNENSSITALRGAPVIITSGYPAECGANPALIFGFLVEAGRNKAAVTTDKGQGIYPARFGKQFAGTLNATLTQAMIGSVANLVKGSSTWYLDTSTSISSVAQCRIEEVAEGFEIGDTAPVVYFTVLQAKIEES